MNHDTPDDSVGRAIKAHPEIKELVLKEALRRYGKFEATPEEVEDLRNLVVKSFPIEKLKAELYDISHQCEDNARELIETTGSRYEELDKLNTTLWHRMGIYQAAIVMKLVEEKTKQNNT